mgnify:CR=1 FL=1
MVRHVMAVILIFPTVHNAPAFCDAMSVKRDTSFCSERDIAISVPTLFLIVLSALLTPFMVLGNVLKPRKGITIIMLNRPVELVRLGARPVRILPIVTVAIRGSPMTGWNVIEIYPIGLHHI